MGQTLNSVNRLGQPFLSVDEQVFVMPEAGRHDCAILLNVSKAGRGW